MNKLFAVLLLVLAGSLVCAPQAEARGAGRRFFRHHHHRHHRHHHHRHHHRVVIVPG